MPLDLHALLDPPHTAVLTMELQRGVMGDLAMIPDLADEVKATEMLDHVAALLAAARTAGARVVHCTAEFRADRAGSGTNAPMLRASAKGDSLVAGTASAEVVPELSQQPSDLLVPRLHGMTPFTGTSLDATLRNCGITTVVATGVSLNVGVTGMVIEAVGLGYTVVVPPDAVAGVPHEYAEQVLQHTIPVIAYRIPTPQIIETWAG
ncbi:MAG: isochorismatase family protein [Acidimicrobiia bacterium]|jgi:nicotinamidase-related amidase